VRVAGRLSRSLSLLVPLAVVLGLLGPTAAARATTYPTLTVTPPSRGTTVTGVDGVFATGSVDPAGSDAPNQLSLYLNGVLSDGPRSCPMTAGAKTCTLSLLFDASNLDGTQALRVDFTTMQGHTVSVSSTFTAVSPLPTAHIDTPSDGDVDYVGDDIDVSATGSPDASQSDDSRTMDLLVDGLSVDSEHCPSPVDTGQACPMDFDWDTSGLIAGSHTLQVKLVTFHDKVGLSPVVHITLAPLTEPVVTITSPAVGASATGTVNVVATGTVDVADGDTALFMGLFVDGNLTGDIQDCTGGGSTCTLSFPWDTAGLSGTHTLQVGFETDLSEAFSAELTVTVSNPPPTVTITSPQAGGSVTGITIVTATGALNPAEHDFPKDMQLIVDGAPYGKPFTCPLGQATLQSCAASFTWNTAGLLGQHNVQVRFDTVKTSALSAIQSVIVGPQPTTTSASLFSYQGSWYAKGTVVASPYHLVVGAVVTVILTPAGGKPAAFTATTGTDGVWVVKLAAAPTVNTTVTATVGPEYGSSVGVVRFRVNAPLTCKVPATIKHAVVSTVTCTVPGLPNGTAVTLTYDGKTGVHVAAHGKAKNGKVTIRFTIAKKSQRLQFWVTTASTTKFSPSQTRLFKVHVI
jgi:Bacterial Ig domain